jgi:xanthine dehydrogenase accessory factor
MVLVGDHPVIESLAALAEHTGWASRHASNASEATGVIATLSSADMIVVAAHDIELAGTALMAALDSGVGYIGALGSHHMQETRAEWLAYRGVTDLTRIHGPAGLDIGATTPSEIAVSIIAEAIASRSIRAGTPSR